MKNLFEFVPDKDKLREATIEALYEWEETHRQEIKRILLLLMSDDNRADKSREFEDILKLLADNAIEKIQNIVIKDAEIIRCFLCNKETNNNNTRVALNMGFGVVYVCKDCCSLEQIEALLSSK